MRDRHSYGSEYIGSSDIASLVLVGGDDVRGLRLRQLKFGGDGDYFAYIGDSEIEVPYFYHIEAKFYHWLKIYDDQELVKEIEGEVIEVYRAREMGCIIRVKVGEEKCGDTE